MTMPVNNRSALLAGARKCLDEQGYARTRARDVAVAAGVSTAAIGYHFGTTESLLIEALFDGLAQWSAQLDDSLSAVSLPLDLEHVGELYECVIGSFANYRGLLAASFELMSQADSNADVAARLREMVQHARRSLAAKVSGNEESSPEQWAVLESLSYGVLSGLIVQWLVDPAALPDRETFIKGVTTLLKPRTS